MLVDHSSDIGQARDCSLKHWKRLLWGVPRFPHNHQQGVLRLDIFLHLFNDVDFQTAEEIHNIGLSEVDRIEEEMLLIVREMGWTFPHFKSDNDYDGTFIIHPTNTQGIQKTFIKCLYQLTLYLKLWGYDPPRVHWDDPNRPSQFLWLSWRCWLAPYKLNNRSWNVDPQSCYKRSTTSSRARLMGSCSKFSTTSQKQRWRSCQWEFQIYVSFSSIIKRLHRL